MNTVKERLKAYIKSIGISDTSFCNAINVSPGFIAGMRKSIQPDKLEVIADLYPSLDIGWLLTGRGEMIKQIDRLSTNASNKSIAVGGSIHGDAIYQGGEAHEKIANSRKRDIKRKDEYISDTFDKRINRYEEELKHSKEQIELKDSIIRDLNKKITDLLEEDKRKFASISDMQRINDFASKREGELLNRIKELTSEVATINERYTTNMTESNRRYAKLSEQLISMMINQQSNDK
jgi:transcriptional regulator with XRE-family HTH domain